MGRPFWERLESGIAIYACRCCHTPLAKKEDLMSKSFHACSGRAYLFNRAANVRTGPQEERLMTTGMHLVSDLFCISCCCCVGWKYDYAYDEAQKYKEGKVILERALLARNYDGEVCDGEATVECDYKDTDSEEC